MAQFSKQQHKNCIHVETFDTNVEVSHPYTITKLSLIYLGSMSDLLFSPKKLEATLHLN